MTSSLIALGLALLAQDAQPQPDPETPEQPAPEQADDANGAENGVIEDDESITIIGQRRGSVIGDIPPITELDARDIRATGATNVSELLEALAPEIGSAQGRGGGRPVLLVDGRRISGFRELRDLPSEAIERVEILPEEVALKYGYRADQRVVNFVLRENFFSTTLETEARFATRGGRTGGELEADRLMLSPGKRTTFNIEYEHDGALTEDERDIVSTPIETADGTIDPSPFRTLIGSSESIQLGSVIKRPLGSTQGTIDLEVSQTDSENLLGPAIPTLGVPAGSSFGDGVAFDLLRDAGIGPLVRDGRSRNASAAFVVNSAPGDWLWSSTGSLNWSENFVLTDRGADASEAQRVVDAGGDPGAAFAFGPLAPRDRSLSQTLTAGLDGVLNGTLFDAGAGDWGVTFRAGATHLAIDSESRIDEVETDAALDRQRLFGAANLDAPLLEDSAIGDVTASVNGQLEYLSDFDLLTTYGANINWRPTGRLRLLGGLTIEEGAPSLGQLGNPRTVDPLARIFDFTTGENVIAEVSTGGNTRLLADRRTEWKLGANYEVPVEGFDLSLRADYVSSTTDNPSGAFPSLSSEIEAAFPDRFTRNPAGDLVAVDLTPVNYAQSRRDVLRYGFSFSKSLKPSPPSEEDIRRFRERVAEYRARRQGPQETSQAQRDEQPQGEGPQRGNGPPQRDGQQGGNPEGQGQEGQAQQGQGQGQQAQGQQGARRGGGRRGGGGGRFNSSDGPRGGRLYAAITHEVALTDELLIAEGGPLLDYLDGAAQGRFGGRPRHTVEGRLGLFNNGIGARVSVDWRSGTEVETGTGTLDFDDYGTVDLRLYANLTERLDVVTRYPWLVGTQVRIGIDNVLDQRPRVTNGFGDVPFTYQPGLLEPEGRTISLELRKLFVPFRFMGGGGFGGGR